MVLCYYCTAITITYRYRHTGMGAFSGFDWSRALFATAFVFVTTADDAVWLVPVLRGENHVKMLYAATFVVTLQLACLGTWLGCLALAYGLVSVSTTKRQNYERKFQLIAIVLTWTIAFYFFVKKMLKIWRKRSRQRNNDNAQPDSAINSTISPHYEAVSTESNLVVGVKPPQKADERLGDSLYSGICFVATMTLLGALDEIAVFPSLLLGGTFSVQELSFGCLVASLIVLFIVYFVLESCKNFLDFLDSIPLYAIVAFIAVIQTVEYFAKD
jgi:hypothetical protein